MCGRRWGGWNGEKVSITESVMEILLYRRILHRSHLEPERTHTVDPTDPEASQGRVPCYQSCRGQLVYN